MQMIRFDHIFTNGTDGWFNVDRAFKFVSNFNLDFVPYEKCSTDIEVLNALRDKPSEQAVKCGILEPRLREGVVLRPLIEMELQGGYRIIAKHKNDQFRETKTPRYLDSEYNVILEQADAIADEWVTPMRLQHVLQRFSENLEMKDTNDIIKAMIEDVEREAEGEIVKSKSVRKAIAIATVKMFKEKLKNKESE